MFKYSGWTHMLVITFPWWKTHIGFYSGSGVGVGTTYDTTYGYGLDWIGKNY